jgi:methyl-accepting chemotaxis protein
MAFFKMSGSHSGPRAQKARRPAAANLHLPAAKKAAPAKKQAQGGFALDMGPDKGDDEFEKF